MLIWIYFKFNNFRIMQLLCLRMVFIEQFGYYWLATFTSASQFKEVSIRNIIGADLYRLFGMLSKDLIIPVIAYFVVSVPIAYIALLKWLDNFTYHIEINLFIFGIAIISMFFIAWITVSYRTFKIIRQSP